MIKFISMLFCFKVLKQKTVSTKTVNIQAVFITIFVLLICTIASKTHRYNYNDKFLIEGKNNLIYTVARLEKVEREIYKKGNIITEYKGELSLNIDGKVYSVYAVIPKDYNKYIYIIKVNMDNTNYFEVLPVLYKELLDPNIKIPSSGWNTNPIPSLTKNKN